MAKPSNHLCNNLRNLESSLWRPSCSTHGIEAGAGLTHKELAERSGVAQSTTAQIEDGACPNPHPLTLTKLAEALDLRARDLLPDE
jgi:DNA-binding XRE family transcriptional regulator